MPTSPTPPPTPPAPRWTAERRVTFCLALAASGSVTFAAASAGLSRKSAYARKGRDAGFAAWWDEALAAAAAAKNPRCQRRQGDEVEEVDDPPVSPGHDNSRDARRAVARATPGPPPPLKYVCPPLWPERDSGDILPNTRFRPTLANRKRA